MVLKLNGDCLILAILFAEFKSHIAFPHRQKEMLRKTD